MTLLLDIPEQKLKQAELAVHASGKTLQQVLEDYIDMLSQQKTQADQHIAYNRVPLQRGAGRNLISFIADDFTAPLPDFDAYM